MFFSGSEQRPAASGRYDLIVEASRKIDAAGFKRVWLPERHFVDFGALHPNPAVLAAYLASCTQNVRLAAGSVVAPLHDPVRIAEDWSVVDNLSGGRVDVALASGWLESDFVLAPELYNMRHDVLRQRVSDVCSLWAGGKLKRVVNGTDHDIVIRPHPVQAVFPLWITAARSTDTFKFAGAIGANVLTYLVDLGFDKMEEAIAAYKEARAEHGFDPKTGSVAVMLHTFLGTTSETVREVVAKPYRDYLFNNRSLLLQSTNSGSALSEAVFEEMADIQFERVFEKLSLIGSFDAARETVHRLSNIGVTEVACLIDFVDDDSMVMESVDRLVDFRTGYESNIISPDSDNARASRSPDLVADRESFYDYIGSLGGFYGDEFRLVEQVSLSGDTAETILRVADVSEQGKAILVDAIISTAHAFALRPSLRGATMPLAMPAGVGSMTLGDVRPGKLTVTTVAKGRSDNIELFDAVARDERGSIVCQLSDIAFNRLRLALSDPRVEAAIGSMYEVVWTPADETYASDPDARFIIHSFDTMAAQHWTAAFQEAGFEADVAADPNADPTMAANEWHILAIQNPENGKDVSESSQDIVLKIVTWTKALRDKNRSARWVVLMQEGQQVTHEDPLPDPVAASAWAAAGSLTSFVAPGNSGPIDLDNLIDAKTALGIAKALANGMTSCAIRDGRIFKMGYQNAGKPDAAAIRELSSVGFAESALVLGGTGALGSTLAAWLGEEGATDVVAISRRGDAAMVSQGHRIPVQYCKGDVSHQQIEKILAAHDLDPDRFGMVFHLAGVDLPEAEGVTPELLQAVFGPKLGGLQNLGTFFRGDTPKHFILFSSLSALRGSQGQIAYSAANAATAAMLRRLTAGTPHKATIIHYGPWAGGGMAMAPVLDAILQAKGVSRIAPEVALRALGLSLITGRGEVVIASLAGNLPMQESPTSTAQSIFVDLAEAPVASSALAELRDMDPAIRRQQMIERLRNVIAEALELQAAEVEEDVNLYDLGFDSLMAVELRNTLTDEFGIEIGLVVLMDAKTVVEVVDRLLPLFVAALDNMNVEVTAPASERSLII